MGVGSYVKSSTFSVGGSDWNILFYPDGRLIAEDRAASVSVYLCLRSGKTTGVTVRFSFSLPEKDGKVSKPRVLQ